MCDWCTRSRCERPRRENRPVRSRGDGTGTRRERPRHGPRGRRHFTSANVGEAARLLPGHAVAIDFSAPGAVPAHVEAAAAAGVPLVQGTTGWQGDESTVRKVVESLGAALVYGANFSIGVNLFYRIVADAARLFRGAGYDPFIEEAHHAASATRRRGPRWRCRPSCHAALDRRQDEHSNREHPSRSYPGDPSRRVRLHR